MVSKETKEVPIDVPKKGGRRRRRRAGSRASKRRAKKLAIIASQEKILSPMKCAVHTFLLKYQSALRKIPAQFPPRVHAGPPSKRVKRVSWRK